MTYGIHLITVIIFKLTFAFVWRSKDKGKRLGVLKMRTFIKGTYMGACVL